MISSTSSSNKKRRSLPLAAFLALVLVAVFEVLLHANSDAWFSRARTGDFRSDSIDECIRLAEQPIKLRVAVVGSSISGAVKAETISKYSSHGLPSAGANFVMFSANPRGVERLLETVVLPNQTPDYLILPVSSRDVNDTGSLSAINNSIPDLASYARSAWQHRLERLIERHFYLWRYRQIIKDRVYSWLRPAKATEAEPTTTSVDLTHREFAVQPASWGALHRSLQLAREQGITPMLVALPVNPSQATASYRSEEQQWLAAFARFAQEEHCLFLSADTLGLTPDDYRDAHHLNASGAERLTQLVGKVLTKKPHQ